LRAPLILIADVLAHRFKSLWIYIALVMVCAAVRDEQIVFTIPSGTPPVAGVRTRTGTASPSALLPALDWIHQLAAVLRYCAGNSSSGTGDGHSDAASGGSQNNMRQAPDSQRHRAQPWCNTRTRISTSSSITTTVPDAVPTPGKLNMMYWNIYHDFTLKLTSNEFHDILKLYDIMFFAETGMLPGEEDVADFPRGYSLVSLPRKPRLETNRRGGGVALLIRDNIEFVKSKLSS
jgi:hypothetical protein